MNKNGIFSYMNRNKIIIAIIPLSGFALLRGWESERLEESRSVLA